MENFDPTMINNLLNHDDTDAPFVNKLVQSFETSVNSCLDALKDNMKDQDIKNIKGYAHRIAGTSANIGAKSLSHLSKKIENRPESLSQNDLSELHTVFNETMVAISKEFHELIK